MTIETTTTETTTTETEATPVSVEVKTETEAAPDLSAADVAAIAETVADEIEAREAQAEKEAEESAKIETLQLTVNWMSEQLTWLHDELTAEIRRLEGVIGDLIAIIAPPETAPDTVADGAAEIVDNPAATVLGVIRSSTKKGKTVI